MKNFQNESEKLNVIGFWDFYNDHFQAEHTHPINRGLHVFGTLLGTAFVPFALLSSVPWVIILYPVVHALPGLIGHRLFERNAQVGDVRVLRKDFSPLWFIAGNHVLTYELAVNGLRSLLRFK
jgi:hypothetical protein